ncbi:guanine deaminase, partial [Acrasis kona]
RICGNIIDSPGLGEIRIRFGILSYNDLGIIEDITCTSATTFEILCQELGIKDIYSIQVLEKNEFLIPGFVDTHIHAPQYTYMGSATDEPLMTWLHKYTFPAESKFQSTEHARVVYKKLVNDLLKHGTTTALFFATIHLESTKVLADICHTAGQRAFVGKVCMDRNSPEFYIETTESSLQDTEAFINYVNQLEGNLIQPVVTPRFIPTCSMDLMKGLGALSNKYDVLVQSHCSESDDEVNFSKSLHPTHLNDSAIFEECGLLKKKCVMAHCTRLSDDEFEIFKRLECSISHCSLSNAYFGDAILDVQRCIKEGVCVSLGTDIAGGPSPSLLNSMRTSVIASRLRSQFYRELPINYKTAFHLATMGGAKALCVDHKIGSFEVGKELDALRIRVGDTADPVPIFEGDSIEIMFEKFVNLGDDRNIICSIVKGKVVHKK